MTTQRLPPLVEGIDFYMEDGKLVFTAAYHLKRGNCCNSKCRHCPFAGGSEVLPTITVIGLPTKPGAGEG